MATPLWWYLYLPALVFFKLEQNPEGPYTLPSLKLNLSSLREGEVYALTFQRPHPVP